MNLVWSFLLMVDNRFGLFTASPVWKLEFVIFTHGSHALIKKINRTEKYLNSTYVKRRIFFIFYDGSQETRDSKLQIGLRNG